MAKFKSLAEQTDEVFVVRCYLKSGTKRYAHVFFKGNIYHAMLSIDEYDDSAWLESQYDTAKEGWREEVEDEYVCYLKTVIASVIDGVRDNDSFWVEEARAPVII